MRYRLRTLLILLLVLSATRAWWTNRARVQKTAVRRIIQAGGQVDYSHYYEPIHNDSWVHHAEAITLAPKFMRTLLGEDYFSSVISVDISYDSQRPIDIDEVM